MDHFYIFIQTFHEKQLYQLVKPRVLKQNPF